MTDVRIELLLAAVMQCKLLTDAWLFNNHYFMV